MCGIAGGVWLQESTDVEQRLKAALTSLRHRGPDDRGYLVARSPGCHVGLAQTRLAILDLSPGGHQPMVSRDGRLALVFNGEIYNYRELRAELMASGARFSSDSDTEVLLAAWQAWGAGCLDKLEGMFAFVVHDRENRRLICVRDPFGIKPLFYEQTGAGLLFASEQQALRELRGKVNRPDWQRAYDYLVHDDYDSSDRSFIEGVRHLPPATLLDIDLARPCPVEPRPWWRASTAETFNGSFSSAVEAVREEFLRSVKLQLRSDVPLGVTLSGGIDSSAVACAMRYVAPDHPINTFSYVAQGSRLSEEAWIDRVNEAVGAIPHKVHTSVGDLSRDLDQLISLQGEPFGGTSVYAQYRVFQRAQEAGITVTLDGQGADELLAGYDGYSGRRMLSMVEQRRYRDLHHFARRWGSWPGRSYHRAWMYLGRSILPDCFYSRARKALGRNFQPRWLKPSLMKDAGVRLRDERSALHGDNRGRRLVEELAMNLQSRGLPKLLRHGDRNAMAVSIESRVPFLTQRLANLALSMPEEYLLSDGGETKHVFRAAMRGIVPDEILDRRDKIGFATPEVDWLRNTRGTVRSWLKTAAAVPFLSSEALLAAFDRMTVGDTQAARQVWRWVNYVRWYELQGF